MDVCVRTLSDYKIVCQELFHSLSLSRPAGGGGGGEDILLLLLLLLYCCISCKRRNNFKILFQ